MAQTIRPTFTLAKPNPNPSDITDPLWWFWLQLQAMEPSSKFGGIVAAKPGYHGTGNWNLTHRPSNYSIRDASDRRGKYWKTHSAALDWTFPDAQRGDFRTIDKYTSRLLKSALDAADPRLDMILVEFYGQADNDRAVEGYDERDEEHATSDASHLWHLHLSFRRDMIGEYWRFWALLTVLAGWTVRQWRESLPSSAPRPPAPKPPVTTKLPHFKNGSRVNSVEENLVGTDVATLQAWVGAKVDGRFGEQTRVRVMRYQAIRGLKIDGIAGAKTWAPILKALD